MDCGFRMIGLCCTPRFSLFISLFRYCMHILVQLPLFQFHCFLFPPLFSFSFSSHFPALFWFHVTFHVIYPPPGLFAVFSIPSLPRCRPSKASDSHRTIRSLDRFSLMAQVTLICSWRRVSLYARSFILHQCYPHSWKTEWNLHKKTIVLWKKTNPNQIFLIKQRGHAVMGWSWNKANQTFSY